MTSKAAKKRAHKASRKLRPPRARKAPATPITADPNATPARIKTGLEWMAAKGRLTKRQAAAGQRYGLHFRLSAVDGLEPLRSCLNDEPRGGGDSVPGLSHAGREGDARRGLLNARIALRSHSGMVAACDVICGRGLTPWEAVGDAGTQRDVERLQNTLAIALDLLSNHYDEEREREAQRRAVAAKAPQHA